MNRKNYALLQRYIREAIDLGNVQFAPDRLDGVDTSEPNTPEEETLYRDLINRVVDNGKVSPETADKLRQLIDSEKYGTRGSGFFGGPKDPAQPLYRGHAYPRSWVEKYVGDPRQVPWWSTGSGERLDQIVKKMPPFTLKTPYTFGPNEGEGFRGWTPDIGVTFGFSMAYAFRMRHSLRDAGDKDNSYMVVLVLDPQRNPPDSLLDFSRSVYRLGGGKALSHEKEVMNVAPVQCHSAYVAEMVGK